MEWLKNVDRCAQDPMFVQGIEHKKKNYFWLVGYNFWPKWLHLNRLSPYIIPFSCLWIVTMQFVASLPILLLLSHCSLLLSCIEFCKFLVVGGFVVWWVCCYILVNLLSMFILCIKIFFFFFCFFFACYEIYVFLVSLQASVWFNFVFVLWFTFLKNLWFIICSYQASK
jgi:hypothetical protein